MSKYYVQPGFVQRVEAVLRTGDPMSYWELDDEVGGLLLNEYYKVTKRVSSPERHAYLVTYSAESLLKSSGYIGVFGDLEDELLPEVIPSFRQIGADEHADLFEKALSVLPGYPPIPDKDTRDEILSSWDYGENDDPTEDIFAQVTSMDDCAGYRLRFLLQHSDQFVLTGA